MIRNRIAFGLLGLFLYLFFLLALVPASWLTSAVPPSFASSGLSVSNTRGTLWSGSATLISKGEPGIYRELGSFTWQLAPSFLLSGHLGFSVSIDGPVLDVQGDIGCGPTGVRLRSLTARVDLGAMASSHFPTSVLSPSGDITVATKDFLVRPNEVVGAAKVVWKDASVTGGVARGNYELQVLGGPAAVGLEIRTLKGAPLIDLKGQLHLTQRQLRFAGKVQPGEAASSRLLATLTGANDSGVIPRRQIALPTRFFDVLAAARCP